MNPPIGSSPRSNVPRQAANVAQNGAVNQPPANAVGQSGGAIKSLFQRAVQFVAKLTGLRASQVPSDTPAASSVSNRNSAQIPANPPRVNAQPPRGSVLTGQRARPQPEGQPAQHIPQQKPRVLYVDSLYTKRSTSEVIAMLQPPNEVSSARLSSIASALLQRPPGEVGIILGGIYPPSRRPSH